jgi:hypothetical protein
MARKVNKAKDVQTKLTETPAPKQLSFRGG